MKYGKIFFSLIFLLTLFLGATKFANSQTCSNESECNRLIDEYDNQVKKLQGQGNTLKNQIAQFDAQIKLTSLKIQKTEEEIGLLAGRITQIDGSLEDLTAAFSERAVETYKMAKLGDPFLMIISSDNLNEAFDRYAYLKKIQNGDKTLIDRLQNAQDTYEKEKVDQEDLQAKLAVQKKNLDLQKSAKANLLAITKNDEKKYQQLLLEARNQLASFKRFISGQGGASILSNQTKCDGWGCYYNQRDSQWGNMSLGGNPYSVAEYGCLVSSVSMMASHYRKNIKPNDIASLSSAFVNGTGYLLSSFGVNGTGVNISKVYSNVQGVLDSELSAGRPVIAGLYSGPDHFIVIVRKEGNNYIMHDPFLENGSYRQLTDKYSLSNITSLRLVSFN